MKEFEGQYSDEKLLLKRHENIISFLISKFFVIIVYIISALVLYFISLYIWDSVLLSSGVAIIMIIMMLYYLVWQYKHSWMIITSRRVLKLIYSSLFIEHRREVKLEDIKATLVRKDFFSSLFGYGKIEIQGTEFESNIYFQGIRGHTDIVNYLSRIIDYVKIHGHVDEISRYVLKKERKNKNT